MEFDLPCRLRNRQLTTSMLTRIPILTIPYCSHHWNDGQIDPVQADWPVWFSRREQGEVGAVCWIRYASRVRRCWILYVRVASFFTTRMRDARMWERAGDRKCDCSCSDPVHTYKVLAEIQRVFCHAIHGVTLSCHWVRRALKGCFLSWTFPYPISFPSYMTQPFPFSYRRFSWTRSITCWSLRCQAPSAAYVSPRKTITRICGVCGTACGKEVERKRKGRTGSDTKRSPDAPNQQTQGHISILIKGK